MRKRGMKGRGAREAAMVTGHVAQVGCAPLWPHRWVM